MNKAEEFELTKAQKFASNLTAGIVVALCGLFLLLCGANAIPLSVPRILLASLLVSVGLVFLITGVLHKNTVSVWLAFVFLTPALVEILVKSDSIGAGYSNLYPLYIAIPAISSFFTMLYSRSARTHVYVIGLFGITASLFTLKSSGLLGWAVVLPVIVVFVGLAIILFTVKTFYSKDGDENE